MSFSPSLLCGLILFLFASIISMFVLRLSIKITVKLRLIPKIVNEVDHIEWYLLHFLFNAKGLMTGSF